MPDVKAHISETVLKLSFLILDPKNNIGELITSSLKKSGVKDQNIKIVRNKTEAISYLRERKPPFLACYVDPKSKAVFDLIDEYKKVIPNKFKRYFLLFSQSKDIYSFAQALEEEVDDYIVEPYSENKIFRKINLSVEHKENPTEYKVLLNEVNQHLENGELKKARVSAAMAMTLHPRPSLAYFSMAKVEIADNNKEEAIQNCIKGLQFNKDHFRCLSLLHDLYFETGDLDRSYNVLIKILEKFPLSIGRVLEIFKLAIVLKKFDELQVYCKKILDKENNNIDIIRFCTAGLAICALNFFNKKDDAAGNALINRALKYSQFDPKILRNLYKTLVNYGLLQGSEDIFFKFKNSDKETLEWEVCKYLREIFSTKPVDMIINESEARLKLVHFDEDCYRHLLDRSKKEASPEYLTKIESIGEKFSLQ